MEHLYDLMDLGKDLNALYIEDDITLQQETKKILDRIFASVVCANDGIEGLKRYKEQKFDIIITDIEMPRLDGLSMSRQIKEDNFEMPIIVISAYSNTDYLIDAIAIGIDHYILKPIKMPRLIQTLHQAVSHIVDKKLADSYRQREIREKISASNEKLISVIANATPNPVIVFSEDKIAFINSAFKNMFDKEELKALVSNKIPLAAFLNEKISIDALLKDDDSFLEHLDDLSNKNVTKRKISMKTKKGRKIFLVISSELKYDSNESTMYTFNDITEIEYQRIQIDQYNEYMSDLTYSKYKTSKDENTPDIINKTVFT